MVVLIHNPNSCVSRMTAGNRRTAERLVKKFDVISKSVKDEKADMAILCPHHSEMDMGA